MFGLQPPRHISTLPDSEVAERPDEFRFLKYSGLVVLAASLSESGPLRDQIGQHLARYEYMPYALAALLKRPFRASVQKKEIQILLWSN